MFYLPFKVSCRELHVLKKPIACLDTSPLVEGCNPLPSVPKNDFQRKRGCCRLLSLREKRKQQTPAHMHCSSVTGLSLGWEKMSVWKEAAFGFEGIYLWVVQGTLP